MALSQSPPPLFQQGLSARVRLLIAVVSSVVILQIDFSLGLLKPLRQGLNMVLYPIEQTLVLPRDLFNWLAGLTSSLSDITEKKRALELKEAANADVLMQLDQLQNENDSLRALLDLRKSLKSKTVAARISHTTRDPFSDRVVIDRGSQHGVMPGHPVINSLGVVGQVVRVSPITAEVALITDPALTVPINLPRSGIRSLMTGAGDGQQVQVKYLNLNAEVEVGDLVLTSGLDGLYPPGFPVARVSRIERSGGGQFPKVSCTPTASIGSMRHVLVLLIDQDLLPPAPRDLEPPAPRPKSKGSAK
jgi:rod shape-determining protein MreC